MTTPVAKGPVVGWRWADALRMLHRFDLAYEDQPEGVRAALAAAAAFAPVPNGDDGLDVEARVKLAEVIGQTRAEQAAVNVLAAIVAAAGGEVRVPDQLIVGDVTMSTDYLNGETVYRARLAAPPEYQPRDR